MSTPALPDGDVFRLETVAPVGAARVRHLLNFDDDYLLLRGRSVAANFPADAAYRMNPDFPEDLGLEDALYNLDAQLIAGERLRDMLAPRLGADAEVLPVSVFDHKGRHVAAPYALLHLLRLVDAVDQKATAFEWNSLNTEMMIGVKQLTVDAARVPADATLFRLRHVPDVIGIRRALAEALVADGFTGLAFTPFADYRG